MIKPQYLFSVVWHVADLLIRHVTVEYSGLYVHENILAVGFNDLLVVSLQIFLQRGALEYVLEFLI
jgi:hypothetical protein